MSSRTKPESSGGPRARRHETEEALLRVMEDDVDVTLVSVAAGDFPPSDDDEKRLRRLKRRRGRHRFSDFLFAVSHRYFPPEEAEELWLEIRRHRDELNEKLGRNPGIAVATLDFLRNVRGVLETPTVVSEAQLARVAEVALYDGLTRLFVRSTFMARLERELMRWQRFGDISCVLMLDADDFKRVNDEHGHPEGDRVLRELADVLRDTTRDTDTLGRYGGEELAVILPRTPPAEAYQIAERIRTNVEAAFRGRTDTTVSIGVASFPRDGETAPDLIRRADRRLLRAKREGKNRVVTVPKRRRRHRR